MKKKECKCHAPTFSNEPLNLPFDIADIPLNSALSMIVANPTYPHPVEFEEEKGDTHLDQLEEIITDLEALQSKLECLYDGILTEKMEECDED